MHADPSVTWMLHAQATSKRSHAVLSHIFNTLKGSHTKCLVKWSSQQQPTAATSQLLAVRNNKAQILTLEQLAAVTSQINISRCCMQDWLASNQQSSPTRSEHA
jgi:hypothetical protein